MKPSLAHSPAVPPTSPLPQIQQALGNQLEGVEQLLHDVSWGPVPAMSQVTGHLVESGGKRLRPMLCLLAARLCELEGDPARRVAAASEMIHSASLLHDDVVDQPPLRRGRPAAPQVFGNTTCVLVGDALMARSLVLLGELQDHAPLVSLARCVRKMALGEIQQLSQMGRPHPRLLGYLRVVEGKTSALFAWCATVGDLCPPALRAQLRQFGRRLGMAFQIADDVLDYAGDPSQTGKRVGTDLLEGKFTLPLHYACQAQPELLERALELAGRADPDPEAMARIVEDVHTSGGLDRSRELARTLLDRAHRSLDRTPASPWRDHLHAVADFVVQRNF